MAGGGKRVGAGRPKGAANKQPKPVKELARQYTEEALQTLASIMQASESDAARVSAANAILDRGYGKPSTVLTGGEDGEAIRIAHRIELVGVRPE